MNRESVKIWALGTAAMVFGGAVAGAGATPAWAQDDRRGRTITERPRPELDPIGIRLGAFMLRPSIEAGTTYDDNIFATESDATGDFIHAVAPEISLQSDWSHHELAVFGKGKLAQYGSHASEDYNDGELGARVRVDPTPDSLLRATIRHRWQHDDRASLDDAAALEPAEYRTLSGLLEGAHKWNRVGLRLGVELDRTDFDDVPAATGMVDHDDRDRDQHWLRAEADYEIVPEYRAFIRLTGTSVDYLQAVDNAGLDRDSTGYEVVAGTRIDLTGLVSGDVYAGWVRRDYEDPALSTIGGLAYGAGLSWNVTPLTTAKLLVNRTVEETTIAGAAGNFQVAFRASVDHELMRSVVVGGYGAYLTQELRGVDRQDETALAGLSAKVKVTRQASLVADYNYANRRSDAAGEDYGRHQISLRLRWEP